MIWTPESVAKLAVLWQSGKSVSMIAKEFDITRSAAAGKLHRVGLMGNRVENRLRKSRERTTAAVHGSWDVKVFEPYVAFKARKQMERRSNGVR